MCIYICIHACTFTCHLFFFFLHLWVECVWECINTYSVHIQLLFFYFIYLSIYLWGAYDKLQNFFRMGTFIDSKHMKLVPFELISPGCNALVVPFQQLLEDPMEVLLCERVNDLRHSLFHLLNCLITTASELREKPKVTGSKVCTIGRLRNCLDAHLGQIVCDKDGVVDWYIVLVEMPLSRFEECWPLLTESLPELP